MSDSTHLMTWVTRETKERFSSMAHRQGLSESALLKGLVLASISSTHIQSPPSLEPLKPIGASGRLSIRLRCDDLLLLHERAKARAMPTSTYVSLLTRSHLRRLTPLPSAELDALKQAVAEMSAIGRNLNQIARALNQGAYPSGLNKTDLYALLRGCMGLRDAIKSFINANLKSWAAGYEKTSD
jgi:Bacterial mobilisation protein (MobC)